jgi:urease subunit gamma/beta
MHLTPREIEKLMLHQAGSVAQKRYARGLRLNYPEAMALIAVQLLEFIREGESVAALMNKGKQLLGFADVMEGVAGMIHEVQVEGTFPDGTKLVTVHHPICRESGDPALALYGSGLARKTAPAGKPEKADAPGEVLAAAGELELNAGRAAVQIDVMNTGDRPVQVGSHYPFFETNRALRFDRAKAFGRRLDIPSGTAVRFEPGEKKRIALIEIEGHKLIYGGNALTDGGLDAENHKAALARVTEHGFENQ